MSISGALSNALSGLSAASRATQVASDNVANVQTEGFGRREIQLSARGLNGSGAGVRVDGIRRDVDLGLLQDRRSADAALGYAGARSDALTRLSNLVGTPDDAGSVAGRLRAFEASLIEAGSRPDSEPRLSQVLASAQRLAGTLNQTSDAIQAERLAADASIGRQVESLNTGLQQVADLNAQINALSGQGRDVSALEDQKQATIDGIADIVPLRVLPRDGGRVALYTAGGTSLLENTPREIGFTPVNFITPDMTQASGALNGLTIGGRPVAATGGLAGFGGGTLSAAFELRDITGPEAQARLDSFARDLLERFADPALDPTTLPIDPGLFTDAGTSFDPLHEVGLSGRLQINAIIDPAQGGELRRIRDGLGAAVPGDTGNATLIYGYLDALETRQSPPSTAITQAERSSFSLAADLSSLFGVDTSNAELDRGFAASRQSALVSLELERGVDTDQELQQLLLIEQSYAANARVIQTIDGLIEELLRI
ncbi:MAG: flagellar hook-associated protein FlgK [Pseudomonadota bacterium]